MLASQVEFGVAGLVAVGMTSVVDEGAGLPLCDRFTNLAQTPPLDQAMLQSHKT